MIQFALHSRPIFIITPAQSDSLENAISEHRAKVLWEIGRIIIFELQNYNRSEDHGVWI
jgi:hypothetical protein